MIGGRWSSGLRSRVAAKALGENLRRRLWVRASNCASYPGTPASGEFYDPILAPRPFDALPQPRAAGAPNAADSFSPDVPGADDR